MTRLSQTIRFVRIFDRFFDCLNVTSLSGGRKALKADLYPYRTPHDTRFEVSHSVGCMIIIELFPSSVNSSA